VIGGTAQDAATLSRETLPDLALIDAAAARLRGHVRETPVLESPGLNALAGRRVLVKAESLQHTGSFKYRGAKSAITALVAAGGCRGVVAYSSGNHGQGIARAAAEAGVPAVIVMPADAPHTKARAITALGAEIIAYDRRTQDREAIAHPILQTRGFTLIPPYDDRQVIAGQATAGLELARQAAAMGVTHADVLTCCGGGGLSAGLALALGRDAPGLRVRTVEPVGFDDMARSLRGTPGPNAPDAASICDAILTPAPGRLTLPILQHHAGPGIAISDDDTQRAMAAAFAHLRIVLEPGGAVGLAAALAHDGPSDAPVIAIASGGNVDADLFIQAVAAFATQVTARFI